MSDEELEEMTEDEEEQFAADLEATPEVSDDDLSARDLPAADRPALDVREIGLDQIEELGNIRPAYHGIQQLADTMHLEGQLQPIVVRNAIAKAEHGKDYELIFGHRRKRAAEELGWETIRAEVRHDAENDNFIAQMIVENFAREELSPIAEANAMLALKNSVEPAMTNAAIARMLGCDPSHVSHRIKMVTKLAMPREYEDNPNLVTVNVVPTNATEAVADADENTNENLTAEEVAAADSDSTSASAVSAEEAQTPPQAPVEKKRLDILALIDQGVIDGSTAEVIASLDDPNDQQQLCKLVIRNEWGVKKAAAWARAAKQHELDEGDDDVMGPVEMLKMEDVADLQSLRPRPDLEDSDIQRIVLYALLRNGLDTEMLEYLAENMGYPYENLWEYAASLSDDQVQELIRRLALRYISAAHRFFDLEPALKDSLGLPEEASDEDLEQAQEAAQVALPGDNSWATPALPDADEAWGATALPGADEGDE